MSNCEEVFNTYPYDNDPYLIIPKRIFKIKLGNQLPVIAAYVWQKSNLFGDPLPLNIAGMEFVFNIYKQGKLIGVGDVVVADLETSKIEYKIKKLDFLEEGEYLGEFAFKDIGDDTFSLPILNDRQRVLIKIV